jgi:hypothetical protein
VEDRTRGGSKVADDVESWTVAGRGWLSPEGISASQVLAQRQPHPRCKWELEISL